MSTPNDPTGSLTAFTSGDTDAAGSLLPQIYENLRALAGHYLQRERPDHTLQPTALVHEAYIRLINIEHVDWKGKSHFFAMAARQMRRVLVDHARGKNADKRQHMEVELSDVQVAVDPETVDVLALHDALEKLASASPRQAQVVELRVLGGLTVKELAFVLGVSRRTIDEDWRVGRAWLRRELRKKSP